MKKTIIAALALAAIASSSAYAGSAGGRIDFYGSVSESSCNIDLDSQGPEGIVYLPPISVSEITAKNKPFKYTNFNIRLTGCPTKMQRATFKVTGYLPAFTRSLYMKNLLTPEEGGAEGVGITIGDSTSSPILGRQYSSSATESTSTTLKDGAGTFKLYAGYMADDLTKMKPGKIHSYLVYGIDYQ